MTDSTYPLYSVFAFIGFIISLIPLPWHLQAWNSGTCYFMMWSSLACLNQFVNSVVWAGNVINHSPGWCEISIRILLASSVGIPASSLCINRRLYKIASASYGPDERFRALLIDSLICVLFPLIFVALQYVVQGHRFDIFEDIGCFPALFNSVPTFLINGVWPIIIGVISASYCVRSLCAFARRRLEFSQFMKSNASSLTMARYFRLMALAMSEILFTTPLAIFTLYLNTVISPVRPWKSWDDTHFQYDRIRLIPSSLWRISKIHVISLEFTRWAAPLCAIVFFAFFGFGDEARRNYSKCFWWIARQFRKISPPSNERKAQFSDAKMPTLPKKSYSPSSILPAYSPPPSASFSPTVLDIKRESSAITQQCTSQYGEFCSTISEKDAELGLDTPTVCPYRDTRSSWKTVFTPFSERRHSSYF